MNKIRRKYLHSMFKSSRLVKAFALSIFVKRCIKSSSINKYSINKLHEVTGLHPTTIRKRLNTLSELGLIEFRGNDKSNLVFSSIVSRHTHSNVAIPERESNNIKDIEQCLYAMLMIEIQKRKDFAKHIIQRAYECPKSLEDMKSARRKCRQYGYGREYKEYGLSYRTIATKIGVSLVKAFDIVKFAVDNKFIKKINNVERIYQKGVLTFSKYMDNKDYTFVTDNNIYLVNANTYSILGGIKNHLVIY